MLLPLLRLLASMHILVVGLLVLAGLTVWGTLYQVDHGLQAAQDRFFSSWFVLVGGVLPLPGTKTVLWALALNLLAAFLVRFRYRPSQFGLVVTHLGLVLYLVGAYVTYHHAEEGQLTLMEGESGTVAIAPREWEVALWKEDEKGSITVQAIDFTSLVPGKEVAFPTFGVSLRLHEVFPNAALSRRGTAKELRPLPLTEDPSDNRPGFSALLEGGGAGEQRELLLSAEQGEVPLGEGGQLVAALRQRRLPLPFTLTLFDFRKVEHLGTSMARSFESRVTVRSGELEREVLISMNNPLRHGEYTLFQSSYGAERDGRESSTFTVVRNRGKYLPYLASMVTILGLLLHFGIMVVRFTRRSKASEVTP